MKKIISLFFALACLCTACNRPFEMDLPLAVSSNRVELKKEAGDKSEKDLYLGLSWLMREGKISAEEAEKDLTFSLIG